MSNPCILLETPGEYERCTSACEMVMETGWIPYMAQQWQLMHEDRLLDLSKDIPRKEPHFGRLYHDPGYWYTFHYGQADINLCLNLEIDLRKQVSRGEIPLGMCILLRRAEFYETTAA